MTFFILLRGDNPGLDHFPVKVISFTGPLTHTCKDGETTVCFCNVVNEFHDNDRFADTRTTKHATLTALEQRADEVDDFNSCWKHFRIGRLLG